MYERFSELLQVHEITPYKVSKETGVSQQTLSDWKNGKSTPKVDKLQKIADYFNVSLDWLRGNSEYRNLEDFNNLNANNEKKEKLRSISRLENSEFTPEEDEQILDFINYIRSKRGE